MKLLAALALLLIPSLCAAEVVSLNDTIVFQRADLKDAENLKTIEWSQSFSDRKEQYAQITAFIEGKDMSTLMLFVHKSFIPKVEEQCAAEVCKLKVSSSYQYGQNKDQTLRFLVLHDKSNTPYQHRFLSTTTLATFSKGATKLAANAKSLGVVVPGAGAGAAMSEQLVKGLSSVVGDPLRNF